MFTITTKNLESSLCCQTWVIQLMMLHQLNLQFINGIDGKFKHITIEIHQLLDGDDVLLEGFNDG